MAEQTKELTLSSVMTDGEGRQWHIEVAGQATIKEEQTDGSTLVTLVDFETTGMTVRLVAE